MDKEHKKRGRRGEKKSHREKEDNASVGFYVDRGDGKEEEEQNQISNDNTSVFFGLVDKEEMEYFKQAESTLAADSFASPEECLGFISSVFEESKGKELKLVTNQICSKLIERLILSSDTEQLKGLYKAFRGHIINLSQHKYSSHCLETLLVRGVSVVEEELLNPELLENNEDFISMEDLFLSFVNEIEPQIQPLLSNAYGSHVVRLILILLASRKLPSSTLNNSTLRSKRSKIARKMIYIKDNDDYDKIHQVPSSFKNELNKVIMKLTKNIDTRQARELSINKISSPVIQLILDIEGQVEKTRPFWHVIFKGVDDPEDPKEGAFVEYLLSDPVGSHFLEAVVEFEKAKYIKRLYRLYMASRIEKLAKREAGSYVVQGLLRKLGSSDVKYIIDALLPELKILLEGNLDLVKTIVEVSNEKNYEKEKIIEIIFEKYTTTGDNEQNHTLLMHRVLKLATSTLGNTNDDWPTAEERRCSLFLQTLNNYDPKFLEATMDGLLDLETERLLQMCKHGVFSHVVDKTLQPSLVIVKRRRFFNKLNGNFADLACNAYGSHIIDALWDFLRQLNMFRERIAIDLFNNRDNVTNNVYGKSVWKNWKMELYTRKPYEWKSEMRQEKYENAPPKVKNSQEIPKTTKVTNKEKSSKDSTQIDKYEEKLDDNIGKLAVTTDEQPKRTKEKRKHDDNNDSTKSRKKLKGRSRQKKLKEHKTKQ